MRKPGYSVSQKIGTLGKRVFVGGHPDSWLTESEPAQNSDFGFDMSMWLEALGEIRGRFSVQIKSGASTQFAGPETEHYIQVELTPETCNLYLQDGQPVLLVFVALQDETSTSGAQMYYLWIEEELRKRLGGRLQFDESDPDNMTLRVPVANRLTKDLDVSAHLDAYWTHTRISNQLRSPEGIGALRTVSSLSPRAQSALTATDHKSLDRWLTHETMTGDNLWPTPKSGTAVAKIKQLNDALNNGSATEADRFIEELNREQLEDVEVLAEFRYQEGRRAFLEGRPEHALDRFAAAGALQPESAKFYAAELEAAVASNLGSTPRIPPELLSRAGRFESEEEVRFQLVRVFALEENYGKAEELLSSLTGPNRAKAETLYFAIKDDWSAALSSADRGLSMYADTRTTKFLKILRLRALLNIVTDGQGSIPIGGRPDLKVSDALALRDSTLESLREAQESGWPANSEMILDCASAVCVTFGPDRELLNLLSDFAQKRPSLRYAQEALARIATFIDEPSTAIAALKRIEDPDPADLARLVLLYSEFGSHTEAVDLALAHLIDKPHETLVDVAVATAAVSAYRLGSTAEETKLRAFVAKGDIASQSLLQFITNSLKDPEAREQNLDRLWEDAMRGGGNETLQDNLLQYLRPDREVDIDRILQICTSTLCRRNLTEMESAKFSAALLRRERFQDLIDFTARAQEFYPKNENVGLARAIALEKIGQPSAAERVLRRFDQSFRTDLVSARTQLLLRIGDVDALISLTKRALAAATDRADRFHYHRTLATLYSRGDRSQYLESVWRLGEAADKEVETEEGTFLLHFLMATADASVEVSQHRVQEFQERVNRFTEKFPSSSMIRVGHISEDASPEDLLSQLQRMAGISEERARTLQKARAFGARSGSHIPFAFRPRTYAPYASNVPDLLRISMNSWHTGESSRIIVGDAAFPRTKPSLPPILDLVSLFLLVDLGLFEKLLAVWTAVAIPKESLAHLSELMFGPLDAGSSDLIDKVTEAIRRNHSAIVQPGPLIGEERQYPQGELATIKAEVESRRHEYLAVDLAMAAILSADESITGRCRTLWDFLEFAEGKGSLSRTDATLVRLRVASWNTQGTPLEPADIVAAALGAVDSPNAGDDAPAARAAIKFFASGSQHQSLEGSAAVLAGLAGRSDPTRGDAAAWFVRLFFREATLARSIGFNGNADDLTAQLAVLSVAQIYADLNAHAMMEFVWRVLESARVTFGGSQDRDNFFKLVGKRAARLFDGIVKKHGIGAMSVEGKITDLLFSLTAPGTQGRTVLENAYFGETKTLQM
ncbi:DUF4365 domain-containing protein [Silanimonas sp.]|uniref:DUF4365 domain-containing protein n=1 Tax=Silanimonas sp. TaxID=1929290 RepID=UPI0022C058A4|nr:DUF4365 domain-containing protein [Silanimonas sp.]MCZ8166654.1 DUF4365 domain-containing protein [Silanimonas sp.]